MPIQINTRNSIGMITLAPFTENDFEVLKSWINNSEELFQFAGPIFTYPLTDDQLRAYIKMPSNKSFKVILNSTKETIGHCELNYENGNNRLSRILIGDKNLRGQKIGEQIVATMAELLFQNKNIKAVDLNVFSWNKAAVKCYEKVGFIINHEQTDDMTINGKVWTRLNMILKRN